MLLFVTFSPLSPLSLKTTKALLWPVSPLEPCRPDIISPGHFYALTLFLSFELPVLFYHHCSTLCSHVKSIFLNISSPPRFKKK